MKSKICNNLDMMKESQQMLLLNVSSQKTVDFGLKPGNCLVFNCPDLKVGAIDVRNIQGFSHINKSQSAFLDWTLKCFQGKACSKIMK